MSEETPVLVPRLVLDLEGDHQVFAAFAKPNQWALMQNAQATKSGNNADQLASTFTLAISSVMPQDRDRFQAYMLEHGQADDLDDALTDALVALWEGRSMLPLDSTSPDSSGSTGASGSTSTDDSSRPDSSQDETSPTPGEMEATPEHWPMLTPVGSSIPA